MTRSRITIIKSLCNAPKKNDKNICVVLKWIVQLKLDETSIIDINLKIANARSWP